MTRTAGFSVCLLVNKFDLHNKHYFFFLNLHFVILILLLKLKKRSKIKPSEEESSFFASSGLKLIICMTSQLTYLSTLLCDFCSHVTVKKNSNRFNGINGIKSKCQNFGVK